MPPTITPTEPYALVLKRTQDLIANCGTFQTITGAINAAAAAAFIYWYDADGEPATARCIIRGLDGEGVAAISSTGYDEANNIRAFFEWPIPGAYATQKQNAYCDLLNKIGAIRREMLALIISGRDLYPQFDSIKGVAAQLHFENQEAEFPWAEVELAMEFQQ